MRSYRYIAFALLVATGFACVMWFWLPVAPRASFLPNERGTCGHMQFSPDGQTLAIVHSDQHRDRLHLFNVIDGIPMLLCARLHTPSPRDWLASIAFSPKEMAFANSWSDGEILLFNRQNGQLLKTFRRPENWEPDLPIAFSSEGRLLIYGPKPTSGKLWDLETGAEVRTLFRADEPWTVAVKANQQPGFILFFNRKGVQAFRLEAGGSTTFDAESARWNLFYSLSDDGRFAVGKKENAIKVWTNSGKEHALAPAIDMENCVISPDGRFVVATISRPPASPPRFLDWFYRLLFKAEWQYEVRILEVATRTHIASLPGAHLCRFSPDGRMLAVAGDDGSIRLYDFPLSKLWTWPAVAFVVVFAVLWAGRRLVRAGSRTRDDPKQS